MSLALHKDPTFERVAAMEIRERKCRVCTRRRELSTGAVLCGTGKRFPLCRSDKKNGFKLDMGTVA